MNAAPSLQAEKLAACYSPHACPQIPILRSGTPHSGLISMFQGSSARRCSNGRALIEPYLFEPECTKKILFQNPSTIISTNFGTTRVKQLVPLRAGDGNGPYFKAILE
jgi:hypothetical protein